MNLDLGGAPQLDQQLLAHLLDEAVAHVVHDREELDPILERLGPVAESHLHSGWDVTDPTSGVVFKL